MKVTISSWFTAAALSLFVVSSAGIARAGDDLPSLNATDLARGPYSHMQMLLKKLLFKVAIIDVRVDIATQTRFAAIAKGHAYSAKLDEQLANVAVGASRAVVQMRFLRDVPLSRWMDVVRENLEQARKSKLISADLEKRVGQGLPTWFAALKDRGYEKDDRLVYSVSHDALRTVVVSKAGKVLVDRTEKEKGSRNVVMASYFAWGSDFREPLLRSLLEGKR